MLLLLLLQIVDIDVDWGHPVGLLSTPKSCRFITKVLLPIVILVSALKRWILLLPLIVVEYFGLCFEVWRVDDTRILGYRFGGSHANSLVEEMFVPAVCFSTTDIPHILVAVSWRELSVPAHFLGRILHIILSYHKIVGHWKIIVF